MYHSLLKDPARQGKYVVSPDLFENDLRWLKENGYSFVEMQDLINFCLFGKFSAGKSVVITFDDGYYNNYLYAYPLLEKYDAKMLISFIGKYTDLYNDEKPNILLTYNMGYDKRNARKRACGDRQSYILNAHERTAKRFKKISGETDEHYTKILIEDIGKLQDETYEHTGIYPAVYTYPFRNNQFSVV